MPQKIDVSNDNIILNDTRCEIFHGHLHDEASRPGFHHGVRLGHSMPWHAEQKVQEGLLQRVLFRSLFNPMSCTQLSSFLLCFL